MVDEAFANRLWLETGLKELICGQENDDSEELSNEGEEKMSKEQREELWYIIFLSHVREVLTHDVIGEERS